MDLRALFQKIRPDFDLANPGVEEGWERRDREQFLASAGRADPIDRGQEHRHQTLSASFSRRLHASGNRRWLALNTGRQCRIPAANKTGMAERRVCKLNTSPMWVGTPTDVGPVEEVLAEH